MICAPHAPHTPHAPHAPYSVRQVTGQVECLLRGICGEISRQELQDALGLKGRDSFEKLYLKPALAAGLIDRTIPDKPTSRLQKYRRTEKGKYFVEEPNR